MQDILSVVLLPDKQDAKQFCLFSRSLGEEGNLIKLNDSQIPHLTITQFEASPEELPRLKKEVSEFTDLSLIVRSGGISFVPDSRSEMMWVELQFLKSVDLLRLQQTVSDIEFAQEFPIWNGQGDLFRPHVTLGLLKSCTIPALDIKKFSHLFNRDFNMKLAAGINGPNFTFKKLLKY